MLQNASLLLKNCENPDPRYPHINVVLRSPEPGTLINRLEMRTAQRTRPRTMFGLPRSAAW